MESKILKTIVSEHQVYLVTLRQNISTMQSQLNLVDTRASLGECIPVANPFRRDVVICAVNRSFGAKD
jgi:hypothetical protein